MEALAREFDDSLIFLCTLRDHLTRDEKRRIRAMAHRVDSYYRRTKVSRRVVVLTSYELFFDKPPRRVVDGASESRISWDREVCLH